MLLTLENGVLRDLHRRLHIDVPGVKPAEDTQRSLVLQAAHTVLPEAAVESLPALARAELTAEHTGPLRQAIADTDPYDSALPGLRDQLLEHLTGDPGLLGAITLTDRVHLARLIRGDVPRSSRSDACSGTAPTAATATPTPPCCANCSTSATPG